VAGLRENTRSARRVMYAAIAFVTLAALNMIPVHAQYVGSGSLAEHDIDYWWIAIGKDDLVLLSIAADTPFSWVSELYYSNLTLVQTVSDDFTHNYQFYANATDDYLLKLSSGYYSFNYTVECAYPVSEQPTPVDSTTPIAHAGTDQTVNEDALVTFNGTNSADNLEIVKYTWTFTDVTPRTLTGVSPTYNFTTPGVYPITLNVTDAAGNWATDTVLIHVLPVEFMREPSSVVVVAAVGTGVTVITALLDVFRSLGHSLRSPVSKLPIPDQLKQFLQLYGEEVFETVDKVKLAALEKASFIAKEEVVALGASIFIVTTVFGFVEANGLPHFLNPTVFAAVFPSVLISTCVVKVAEEFCDALCARVSGVYRRFCLWMYGTAAFLISGFVFLFPFSTPGITRYQSGQISNQTKALIVLSRMLVLLTLTIPFAGLFALGFKVVGDAGLLQTLMTVWFLLFPIRPLPGKAVFDYRRELSLIALVLAGIIFYSFALNLLTHVTYLAVGVVSAILAAITIYMSRRAYPK